MLNFTLPTDDTVILIIILATAGAFAVFSLVTWVRRRGVRKELRIGIVRESLYKGASQALHILHPNDPAFDPEKASFTGKWASSREYIATNERRLSFLTLLNLLSTIGSMLFIGLALVSYFLGRSQAAIQLDVVGIVLFVVKAIVGGVLSTMAGRWYTRMMDARKKAEHKP